MWLETDYFVTHQSNSDHTKFMLIQLLCIIKKKPAFEQVSFTTIRQTSEHHPEQLA